VKHTINKAIHEYKNRTSAQLLLGNSAVILIDPIVEKVLCKIINHLFTGSGLNFGDGRLLSLFVITLS